MNFAAGQYWLTASGDLVKILLASDVAVAGNFVEFGEHAVVHWRADGTHCHPEFNLTEFVK